MPAKTAKKTITFETIAHDHGPYLAYLASRHDDVEAPADPAAAEPAALVDLLREAISFLELCHRWSEAEELEPALTHLAAALEADEEDRPALLRQGNRALKQLYDIANDMAMDLGEDLP
ncbi:hypothetical protein ABZW10_36530 [Kitasatospora sp. NPDC004723]|uniref:hypothetical protein n=1 Tax=Kitasatospora sp. NPDC004723 TaxID=3154288 RepID=UPI0033BDF16D